MGVASRIISFEVLSCSNSRRGKRLVVMDLWRWRGAVDIISSDVSGLHLDVNAVDFVMPIRQIASKILQSWL